MDSVLKGTGYGLMHESAQGLLRALPKMDGLLAHPAIEAARAAIPYHALRAAARAAVDALRRGVLAGEVTALPAVDALAEEIIRAARAYERPRLRRVINATGVALHTNLGRAPLAEAAAEAVYAAARGYSNLEYDLGLGTRGSRHAHVEPLLCELTGAAAAAVFHNNAAAVFVMLTALAAGKRVAVSRGELVEIGGGFRVPDIMARTGATLVEVGATNRTRVADYAAVPDLGALLKVHTSNFTIVGFTEEAGVAELAALGRARGVPLLYDLGGGALCPDLPGGAAAINALRDGADVVCFSGDKLLGGPQAGIVLGKQEYIDAIKRDPYARMARADKLTLAALEATLRLYRDGGLARESIPALAMLTVPAETLRERAEALASRLDPRWRAEAVPCDGEAGGGTLPGVTFPGWAVRLNPEAWSAAALEAALRGHDTPIIGRIVRDRLLLDVRALTRGDADEIVRALEALQ